MPEKKIKHIWESKLLAHTRKRKKKEEKKKAHTDNGQIFSKFTKTRKCIVLPLCFL